jgi:cytochrome c1
MPNLATWIRQKDAKSFSTIFEKYPEIKVWNARTRNVPLDDAVIRVYDEASNVMDMHEHAGDLKDW